MKNCLQRIYPPGISMQLPGMRWLFAMMSFLLLVSLKVSAQQTVKGRVTAAGAAVPGVTVQLKGTAVGTQTNAQGEFSIAAPANGTLIVSAIGYATQEVQVGGQTSLQIVLETANQQLNQVVVVGYGTQSKRKLTSAVVTVSGEDLNKRIATNPTTLLQGQLPGLQVVQGSGNLELRMSACGYAVSAPSVAQGTTLW